MDELDNVDYGYRLIDTKWNRETAKGFRLASQSSSLTCTVAKAIASSLVEAIRKPADDTTSGWRQAQAEAEEAFWATPRHPFQLCRGCSPSRRALRLLPTTIIARRTAGEAVGRLQGRRLWLLITFLHSLWRQLELAGAL